MSEPLSIQPGERQTLIQAIAVDELGHHFQNDAAEAGEYPTMLQPVGARLNTVAKIHEKSPPFTDPMLEVIASSKRLVSKAAETSGRSLMNQHAERYFTSIGVELDQTDEPIDHLLALEPEQYGHFAAWHVPEVERQEGIFQTRIEQLKTDFIESYQTCVTAKKLPKIPDDIFNARFNNMIFGTADVFSANTFEGEAFAGVYQRNGAISEVLVASQYVEDFPALKAVVFYELLHAVSGQAHAVRLDVEGYDDPGHYEQRADAIELLRESGNYDEATIQSILKSGLLVPVIETTRVGLREGHQYKWFNEAATEHTTRMLLAASKRTQADYEASLPLAERPYDGPPGDVHAMLEHMNQQLFDKGIQERGSFRTGTPVDGDLIPDFSGYDMGVYARVGGSYKGERKATGALIIPARLGRLTLAAFFANRRPGRKNPDRAQVALHQGFDAQYGPDALPTIDRFVAQHGVKKLDDELAERRLIVAAVPGLKKSTWSTLSRDLAWQVKE